MIRRPVTVLTGCLGAGKTTLLNRLIGEPGFGDTAVVVNEFGEAGVDGALVAEADDRAFAMTTGCLCCTVSGDIRLTLLRLLDEAERDVGPAFDRVVIETTGLADPAPVLQAFLSDGVMLERFTLNGVATAVDALNGADALDRFEEARRQAAVADPLIVTKADLAAACGRQGDPADLEARLARLNPNARLTRAPETTAATLFSLAAFDPSGKPPDVAEWLRFAARHDHGRHHPPHDLNALGDAATAWCFEAAGPVDPWALENAVAALQASFGPDLLRLKGLVELAGHPNAPRVLHAVGCIASPPRLLDGWPAGLDETRIVLIAGGPGRSAAPDMLRRFLPELRPYGSAGSSLARDGAADVSEGAAPSLHRRPDASAAARKPPHA